MVKKETPESCGRHIVYQEEYMWRRSEKTEWFKLKMGLTPWNNHCGPKPGMLPDAINWAICRECSIKQGLIW
jgi:hypothetical protein